MADKHSEAGRESCGSVALADNVTQNEVDSEKQTPKRCASTSPDAAPPVKSPRTRSHSPTTQVPDAGGGQSETDELEMETEVKEGPSSPTVHPTARRKSWRRATITRRSLPVLPNPYQALCRSISTSLPQPERLEKLMEASMRLAIERTRNSLQSVPNVSLESFQKQVERIQKEWGHLARSIRDEPDDRQRPAGAASDPVVQKAMEKVQRSINRLQAESESWEALLNKHRSKAEELERKVEQGKQGGISLDVTSLARSSQYHFIQSKPDYHSILRRQQPMLHTMALTMDIQSKMVRELLSIKEQSELLVKETSRQLAAEAGFQDLSSEHIKNLMTAPLSSATTQSLWQEASTSNQSSNGP